MIRLALVGLGKMGLSHLSIIRAHPEVDLVGVCDTSKFMLDVLAKYTDVAGYTDAAVMFREAKPDAVIVATPSRFHASIARMALEQGLHIFCEKPFCLDWTESMALASLAEDRGVVNQVGYHYRFVGAFEEVRRLVDLKSIGTISHVLAEAYGPVVLRPKGMSWRTQKEEGGGCLYDYATHPVNLLTWLFGVPTQMPDTTMSSIFSRDIEDEVYSSFRYTNGPSVQLAVNWSDESYRKMSVKMTLWGSEGRIYADRQECQVYLRNTAQLPEGYTPGWNVRYTTELTKPVWFYVRGEEYSAQLDYFVRAIVSGSRQNINSFASAAETDRVLAMIREGAESVAAPAAVPAAAAPPRGISRFFRN
jgi:predicted dehydrogenase